MLGVQIGVQSMSLMFNSVERGIVMRALLYIDGEISFTI
jgi:hypothetical protein